MVPVSTELTTARDTSLRDLSSDPEVIRRLEDLHYLLIAAFPDCLVQQREYGELIYIPPEKRGKVKDKNLMTVWLHDGKNVQVLPDDEEEYDPLERPSYVQRMVALYAKWGCKAVVTVPVVHE